MNAARRRLLSWVVAAPFAPRVTAQVVPAPTPGTAPAPAIPAPDPVADALLEVVKRRYGAQLDPQDHAAVRKAIGESRQNGERLRTAARLANADEPVTVFEARPRAGRERKGARK